MKWIKCSERMPEPKEDVFVYFKYFRHGSYNRMYKEYGISNTTTEGKWSGFVNGSSGWRDLKIIAWLPIPEYEEE